MERYRYCTEMSLGTEVIDNKSLGSPSARTDHPVFWAFELGSCGQFL